MRELPRVQLWLERLAWLGLIIHVAFLPISIAGMQIGLGLTVIALVAAAALGRNTWAHTAVERPILALCAAATFSVLAAAVGGHMPVGLHEATLWRTALAPIAIISGLALLSADRHELQRRALLLLALWGAAAILPTVVAWIQYPTGWDPLHALGMRAIPRQAAAPRHPGYFAAMGFFNWYQRLAHNLTPPICLAAAVAILGRDAISPRLRNWLLASAILAATAVGLTFSRSAWVGLAAGLGTVIAFAGRRIARWALPAALALAVLLGALTPSVRDRFANLNNPEYNRDRVTIWQVCAAMVKDNPVTGVGWGSLPQRSQPYYERIAPWYPLRAWCHNAFFSALGEGGAVLLLALIFYWAALAWTFWRWWQRNIGVARAAAAGALGGIVAMLVNAMAHDIFYASESMYGFGFMLGIATALAAD